MGHGSGSPGVLSGGFIIIVDLFLVALGLHCYMRAFSSWGKWGVLFVAVHGLLIVVTSLVAAHRLQGKWAQRLQHVSSVIVAHRFSCYEACEIFPDQGLNPCPRNWQVDS